METEHSRLVSKVGDLEAAHSQTSVELSEEKKKRLEETELLAKKLAEKSRFSEAQKQKALDAENEVLVIKRKNAATLRELTRELQTCQKRLDQQQSQQLSVTGASSSRYSSRASSDVSLNTMENNNGLNAPMSDQSNGFRSPTLSASVSSFRSMGA